MMTSLIRRNPAPNALSAFDSLFRGLPFSSPLLGEDVVAPFLWSNETQRTWMPPVDVRETDEAYLVAAELPGVSKEDVEITVENNVLTLRGERKWQAESNGESFHRVERSYGRFTRTFTLPRTVRPDDVEARFDDGVLYLTLPKAEEARPRRIAIH